MNFNEFLSTSIHKHLTINFLQIYMGKTSFIIDGDSVWQSYGKKYALADYHSLYLENTTSGKDEHEILFPSRSIFKMNMKERYYYKFISFG